MIGPITKISFDVAATEPFHIGSGDTETIETNDGETSEVAKVVRVGDQVVAPGSSIKGALRAMASRQFAAEDVETLFGPAELRTAADGRMGLLTCWSAIGEAEPHNSSRTAIDGASGTAAEHRLFHQEHAPAGLGLRLRFALSPRADTTVLKALIAEICAPNLGLSLGKGSNGGAGRFVGDPKTLVVQFLGLPGAEDDNQSEEWRRDIGIASTSRHTQTIITPLRLTCRDLFISLGEKTVSEGNAANTLKALRDHSNGEKAALPATTVRGALRARAVWLSRCIDEGHRDNRDLILDQTALAPSADLQEARAIVNRIESLSATELLFGVNGWKGVLGVRGINHVSQNDWLTLQSVKLDRFSGGPMPGALFAVEAAVTPVFDLTLRLDSLRLEAAGDVAAAKARSLYDAVVASVAEDGLMLGHGTNKGYGWFDGQCRE